MCVWGGGGGGGSRWVRVWCICMCAHVYFKIEATPFHIRCKNRSIFKTYIHSPATSAHITRTSFHNDNFDEQVLTFDGKNTVHYLLIIGFQRRHGELQTMKLDLKKANSLTLEDNMFGELLPCEPTSNRQFKRAAGCLDVKCSSGFVKSCSPTLFNWQCLRGFEHLLVHDEIATCLWLFAIKLGSVFEWSLLKCFWWKKYNTVLQLEFPLYTIVQCYQFFNDWHGHYFDKCFLLPVCYRTS